MELYREKLILLEVPSDHGGRGDVREFVEEGLSGLDSCDSSHFPSCPMSWVVSPQL